MRQICTTPYEEGRSPDDIAEELVRAGFLSHHQTREAYVRTEMAYTHELSTYLKSWVTTQHARRMKRECPSPPTTQVNIVRDDIDPAIASWFGYPQFPVFLTGRRYYLEDDE